MPIVKIPDADIHYEIHGAGEPVLLVAGLGGTASYWMPNIAALSEKYRVILHDHRGTGQSTHSEMSYSVELMANDLLQVMDSLGIEKTHLIGHSTGGAMGLVLGAIAPQRIASLVLYASWAELDAQMEQCLSLRRRVLQNMGEAEYHRATPLFLYPPYFTRGHKDELAQEVKAAIAGSSSRTILDARVAGIMAFDGLPLLERIHCPTLVLVADDDILTPPYSSELMAARIANAKLVRVPRGGHALSRTEPAAFNDIVAKFLAQNGISRCRN